MVVMARQRKSFDGSQTLSGITLSVGVAGNKRFAKLIVPQRFSPVSHRVLVLIQSCARNNWLFR